MSLVLGPTVRTEQPVPEKIDDREIAARMQVVHEMKLLLVPKPGEASESRILNMIFLVKIYVCVERRCTRSSHHGEEIEWQDKIHRAGDKDGWDEKVWRVVSVSATIGRRHKMALGIDRMMKSDVVPEERAAQPVVTKTVMQQGLAARHEQMCTDNGRSK